MNEKQDFLIFLFATGLLLGAVAMISYIEDPGGVFTNNIYESGLADVLLSDHNAVNLANYDERLLQKDLILKDSRQFDVIVLGSSRSMQIHDSTLPAPENKSGLFFNHAMSGAVIEDYIAILELYAEKGDIPNIIIFGIDPWIFNGNSQQKIQRSRWMSLKSEYEKGMERIDAGHNALQEDSYDINYDINRYTSLISLPIISKSIEKIRFGPYYATDMEESDLMIKLKDGSINYPGNFRDRTVIQTDADAEQFANTDPIYLLGQYYSLDPRSQSIFESTVRYLRDRNVTIILFLPPYHPVVYKKMNNNTDYLNVKETESYLRKIATRENITLIGSYDPGQMNLTSADFYDGMHPRRDTIDTIFTTNVVRNAVADSQG